MRRALLLALATVRMAHAAHTQIVVIDPVTHLPARGYVTIEKVDAAPSQSFTSGDVIEVPLDSSVIVQQQGDLPTQEITIRVTASRLPPKKKSAGTTSATVRTDQDLKKFGGGGGGNDSKQLTKGQAGVAEDSAGQAHVRGEHSEIAFVVDGVPLPDTLSGRQGSVVVQGTIQTLEMITGGFAPEFGGQTAAVLNISTKSEFKKHVRELTTSAGGFGSLGSEFMSLGPLSPKLSYVLDFSGQSTRNGSEPNQPDNQTAHNQLRGYSAFANLRLRSSAHENWGLTFSQNADTAEIPNRAGLGARYASVGQGYGLFGLRNADGTRPDVTADNEGALGAGTIVLPSQHAAGQDIRQSELSRFMTLSVERKPRPTDSIRAALTFLHSGQDVTSRNKDIALDELPIDSSLEYNPTALRSVDHTQLSASYEAKRSAHVLRAGFVADFQSGSESYRLAPGSQLALDALAAMAPSLAPAGTAGTDLDVNGNPIFTATGPIPTVHLKRTGTYSAAYVQDTWTRGKLIANYGLRADFYRQTQNVGGATTVAQMVSPRVNLQYKLSPATELRGAFNRLFNTPPVAQGAVLGATILPETLSQFDLALAQKLGRGQSLTVGYYAKDIRNQVDTGLLIPGSQIGLYSAVNLAREGVHGVELSYEINSQKDHGWDAYLNYSISAARPGGVDTNGEEVPEFNDHDQTHTVGFGAVYTWKSGASLATTVQWGSGLASSVVPPNEGRTPRGQIDLHYSTGQRLFRGQGNLSVDINNLMDERTVVNFQSAFSGTRFQQGRTVGVSLNLKF